MFHSPARRVTSAQLVSSIYIRHYQGILVHVCKFANSPSIQSLKPPQPNSSAAPVVASSLVYTAFAACGKFKLFYNGKLVLQSDKVFSFSQHYALYADYVSVAPGGVFAITVDSCGDLKGLIGCVGPSTCTGLNDGSGWWCSRSLPPPGWMLPNSSGPSAEIAASKCSISTESEIWSVFTKQFTDEQCFGLSAFPAATDVVSCSNACCSDPSCKFFSWCSGGDCRETTTQSGSRCWIGSTNGQRRMSGWVSGVRSTATTSAATWVRAQSQGSIGSRKWVEQGLDSRAQWLWPNDGQNQEPVHCRWTV